jgi:membrane protease YdiL (CAAX protease family)
MTTSHQYVSKLRKGAAFFVAALCSSAAMRLLVRTNALAFDPSVALFIFSFGVVVAWMALQRWRVAAPIRCAAVVGLSSGIAGAGFFIMVVYILACFIPNGGIYS